jgi:hypothetical protein
VLGLGSHKLRADEFSLNSQVQDFNASVFKIKFFFLLLSPHDIAFYNYFNESDTFEAFITILTYMAFVMN